MKKHSICYTLNGITILHNQKLSMVWLLFFPLGSSAQHNIQEIEIASYNIGFGAISTAVAAVINKPKETKMWPCIKKAVLQGAIGGGLQYAGKKMTYQISRSGNYSWGWGSKLIQSAGTSICTNAAMNRKFGSYWAIDYAALHLNIWIEKEHVQIQPQFNILFLYDLYCGLNEGHVDWNISLKSGTFTFANNGDYMHGIYNDYVGNSFTRSIFVAKGQSSLVPTTVSHEIIHTYQVDQFRIFNTYLYNLTTRINNRTIKGLFKYIYIEIPYSYPVYLAFYNNRHYYRNPFEFECESLSTNKAVHR